MPEANKAKVIRDRNNLPAEPSSLDENHPAKKIITGNVVQKKSNPAKAVASRFFGGDPLDVLKYMFNSVVVPMAQDMFVSMMNSGTERLVYGDSIDDRKRRSGSARFGGNPSYRSYASASRRQDRTPSDRREMSTRSRRDFDFDDIILENKAEAEEVLMNMNEDIEKSGSISVAALYELVGITPTYTDRSWGWTDLRGSSVSTVREGYLLNLPSVTVLR